MRTLFGHFAAAFRQRLGFTLSQHAALMGCSPAYLSMVEHRRSPVKPALVERYAHTLRLSAEDTQKLHDAAASDSVEMVQEIRIAARDSQRIEMAKMFAEFLPRIHPGVFMDALRESLSKHALVEMPEHSCNDNKNYEQERNLGSINKPQKIPA